VVALGESFQAYRMKETSCHVDDTHGQMHDRIRHIHLRHHTAHIHDKSSGAAYGCDKHGSKAGTIKQLIEKDPCLSLEIPPDARARPEALDLEIRERVLSYLGWVSSITQIFFIFV
jgi:hypothetical protein